MGAIISWGGYNGKDPKYVVPFSMSAVNTLIKQ